MNVDFSPAFLQQGLVRVYCVGHADCNERAKQCATGAISIHILRHQLGVYRLYARPECNGVFFITFTIWTPLSFNHDRLLRLPQILDTRHLRVKKRNEMFTDCPNSNTNDWAVWFVQQFTRLLSIAASAVFIRESHSPVFLYSSLNVIGTVFGFPCCVRRVSRTLQYDNSLSCRSANCGQKS